MGGEGGNGRWDPEEKAPPGIVRRWWHWLTRDDELVIEALWRMIRRRRSQDDAR
jgi:hypothetical protein